MSVFPSVRVKDYAVPQWVLALVAVVLAAGAAMVLKQVLARVGNRPKQ